MNQVLNTYTYNGWSGINMELNALGSQEVRAIRFSVFEDGSIQGKFLLDNELTVHGGVNSKIKFRAVSDDDKREAVAFLHSIYDLVSVPNFQNAFQFKANLWTGWDLVDAN